jgi:large subunit ribosomal protein L6
VQVLAAKSYVTYGKGVLMSRVGIKPISLPQGVKVDIKGSEVAVKGPKGELSRTFHPDMIITLKDGTLIVSRPSDNRSHRSLHGLTRSLLADMIEGVTNGFGKGLELVGMGYRAQKSGDKLLLQVGYTHPVEINPPPGISFTVEGNNRVIVSGIDKQLVGQVAAWIRKVKPPDSYVGKGVRYVGEVVRLKPGKAGKVGRR